MDLREFGTVEWRQQGGTVHFSFVGFDAHKPPSPDTIVLSGTYAAS